jgi:hypothetical protein
MRVVILVLVAACGSGPEAAEPSAAGPSCAEVAEHLIELAVADNQATGLPDDLAGLEAAIAETCTNESWSPERRLCLLAAPTQDDTLGCRPTP